MPDLLSGAEDLPAAEVLTAADGLGQRSVGDRLRVQTARQLEQPVPEATQSTGVKGRTFPTDRPKKGNTLSAPS